MGIEEIISTCMAPTFPTPYLNKSFTISTNLKSNEGEHPSQCGGSVGQEIRIHVNDLIDQ